MMKVQRNRMWPSATSFASYGTLDRAKRFGVQPNTNVCHPPIPAIPLTIVCAPVKSQGYFPS